MPINTYIYIVRHGQTADNYRGIIQGQRNTPLDETGIKQAKRVADYLKTVPFDVAFSSDLDRAQDTARTILQHHSKDVPCNKLQILRERYMGNQQGHPIDNRPPRENVETIKAFKKRIMEFWDQDIRMLAMSLEPPPTERATYLLVVTHGALISTLVQTVLRERNIVAVEGVNVNFGCKNASVTIIGLEARTGVGTVLRYGDVSHLDDRGGSPNADELETTKELYQASASK